ncbi:hypothetical protein [Clostridium sp.]|uniref:hypothetical protein n=1 Tax=Clostridium sp. TaxID=1506 RepID=UPI002FC5E5E1
MEKEYQKNLHKSDIKRRAIIFFILGLALVTFPFIWWQLKNTTVIDALIIDKTVPDNSYREHKGLVWVLNNLKIFNKDSGKPFDYRKEYYGFLPGEGENYEVKELPEQLNNPELVYITDTYGVYNEDLNKENLKGSRSNIIYGGLEIDEVKKIKASLNNNTIVSEFNTLASPTSEEARSEMEDIFGMKWSGWIGRYFSDLSDKNTEIPVWLIKAYEIQYLKFWDFQGPGFALVKSDDTVVILSQGKEITKDLNKIVFNEKSLVEFKVKDKVDYYYWFDIVQPMEGTEVIANYNISLTEEGKKHLKNYGLQSEFPAILRKEKKYTAYYFAGDFADNNKIPSLYKLSGLNFLNKITTLKIEGNQEYFYWNVYYPLMKKILLDLNK